MDAQIAVAPYDAGPGYYHLSEHLQQHHRYILLINDPLTPSANVVATDWYGILEDDANVLAQIMEGIRQDLPLRHNDYRDTFF